MAATPTQAQTKVTFKFDGKKLDGLAPTMNPSSERQGGVAQGADGPLFQYSGTGETHTISNLKIWVRKSGVTFRPWEHTEVGQEFDVTFTIGDPAFGGRSVLFEECLCTGEALEVDNERGMVQLTIPQIRAVRRSER